MKIFLSYGHEVTLGTGTCHTTKQHDNRTGNKDVIEIRKYEI